MPLPRLKYICLLIVIFLTIGCRHYVKTDLQSHAPVDTTSRRDSDHLNLIFGIPSDSYNLVTGHIRKNGFLSSILLEHGITMIELEKVLQNSKDVFDVRKMRYGNNFTLFCEKDSESRARYLVYEHDPLTCYVFSFNDSLNITEYKKEIKKEIKYVSLTIESSLWDAMLQNGLHPSLVIELSQIYAWSIDFFGLQKGDTFKVIYDELSVDEKTLGIGRIYGARYSGSGASIDAIPFIQDGKESYYDNNGNSLRKAFLKAPLQFARVTSRFSASRLHPILRIRRPHHGVDYAAPLGTPVHSIGDGRVVQAGFDGGSGKMVRIVHNSVYSTAYLHLSSFEKGIAPGVYVKQGDIIGYVGSSGLSTGPHLDFRFYMNGSSVDPLKVEAPPVEPVSELNKSRFEKQKKVVISLLETF